MEVFKCTTDWIVPHHNLRFHFLKIRFFDFPKVVDDFTVDFSLFFGFSRGKTKNEVSSKSLNFSLKAKNHIPGLQTQVPYAIFCSEPVLWQNTHLQRHILYYMNLSSQVKSEVWRGRETRRSGDRWKEEREVGSCGPLLGFASTQTWVVHSTKAQLLHTWWLLGPTPTSYNIFQPPLWTLKKNRFFEKKVTKCIQILRVPWVQKWPFLPQHTQRHKT